MQPTQQPAAPTGTSATDEGPCSTLNAGGRASRSKSRTWTHTKRRRRRRLSFLDSMTSTDTPQTSQRKLTPELGELTAEVDEFLDSRRLTTTGCPLSAASAPVAAYAMFKAPRRLVFV